MGEYEELDAELPPCLHLVSAFLAMEPVETLISLARECGGGLVTENVQRFIWEHCISKARDGTFHVPYLKNFLKKLISEVESRSSDLLDDLYEECASYMASSKEEYSIMGNKRIFKYISFLFSDGSCGLPSCPGSKRLMVPIQCSLNMLEGDTGCSLWPSSIFLSELILSFPEIFTNRSCFEVGSGVGLVGICLQHVKAQKAQIVLSDGDFSTLENMKFNLEMNYSETQTNTVDPTNEDSKLVECIHLQWESTSDSELQDFKPEIVLGADVIYDPICLPHLVRVLAILLDPKKSLPRNQIDHGDKWKAGNSGNEFYTCQDQSYRSGTDGERDGPIAYIASVIRNVDTFNHFLGLVEEYNLKITDITDTLKPLNLLPYMSSYNRSSIRLFTIAFK